MSVLTIQQLRDVVSTSLSDDRLQILLDREEAEIIRYLGNPYADPTTPITEIVPGEETVNLYLRRVILSVTSVSEKRLLTDTSTTSLTEGTDYYAWKGQGRLERFNRLWGAVTTVQYVPSDDREAWRLAEIDLLRLALERTAMKSESIAGEYSYTAADWDTERARIVRRLGFMEV